MLTTRESLIEAVNALVGEAGPALFADLTALVPTARALGARFSGERSVLNPLLSLAVSSPAQFERVIALVERKRDEAYLPPLAQGAEDRFDKADYMRDFMQHKRERERRAVDIENMIRPAHDRLKGRARLDFMQMQSAKWKDARDRALERARETLGRRLRKDEVRDTVTAFWSTIDRELDELEALARDEQSKPTHFRRKL